MLRVQNIATFSDLRRLNRDCLEEICNDHKIPTDGAIDELVERIWNEVKENPNKQTTILERCINKILCGKTSVTWYRLASGASLQGSREQLISKCGYNPFTSLRRVNIDNLTSKPELIAAAVGDTSHEYFLRFIYSSGVTNTPVGFDVIPNSKSGIGTVYVNESTGIIEVRSAPKKAQKIAEIFAEMIGHSRVLEKIKFLTKAESKVEVIAEKLKGSLFDAVSKPEMLLTEVTQQQVGAVVSILTALDVYFADDDSDALEIELQKSKRALGEDLLDIPFAALVLAGLSKVGMGAQVGGLRGTPLYGVLAPYVQNQGGYIRFATEDNQEFTIRVGMGANSIYFASPATESAIDYVRRHVIL